MATSTDFHTPPELCVIRILLVYTYIATPERHKGVHLVAVSCHTAVGPFQTVPSPSYQCCYSPQALYIRQKPRELELELKLQNLILQRL